MWRLVLVLVTILAGAGIRPGVGAAVASALDGTPCTYYSATRTFTGDCWWDQNPGSAVPCQVNYDTHTYGPGCNVYTSAESRPSRPVTVPPGCDTGPHGSFYCPPGAGGAYSPGGDLGCTYTDIDGVYTCVPPPPNGPTECTYDYSKHLFTCVPQNCVENPTTGDWDCVTPSPSPSPSPGGAPECDGSLNMVCNGDFSDAGGVAAGVLGGWYQNASCSPDSYEQTGGGALFQMFTFDNGPCGNPNRAKNSITQRTRGLPLGAVGYFHLSLSGVHTSRGSELCARARYWLADGYEIDGCFDVVTEPSHEFVSGLKTIHIPNGETTVSFEVQVLSGSGFPGITVDDVYFWFDCTSNCSGVAPSPSPSPSPGSGPPIPTNCVENPTTGDWDCTGEGQSPPTCVENPTTHDQDCTGPAPVDDGTYHCVLQPDGFTLVCQGPIPPGNGPSGINNPPGGAGGETPPCASPSPSPSASPSASPSPSPSGRPDCTGAGGTVDAGGPAGDCSFSSIVGLRSLGHVIVCTITNFMAGMMGAALWVARGLGQLLDIVRVPLAALKAIFAPQEDFLRILRWFFLYTVAIVTELSAALTAPATDGGLFATYADIFTMPLFAQMLTAVAGLVWLAFGFWVVKTAGKVANG